MKLKLPKIQSVTIKAALISGLFSIIAALILKSSDSNNTKAIKDPIKPKNEAQNPEYTNEVKEGNILIQGIEKNYSIDELIFVEGNDVDLVQLTIDHKSFELDFDEYGLNVRADSTIFRKWLENQELFDSISEIELESSVSDEIAYNRIYQKMPIWDSISPILDITLFNNSKKNLVISNLEIEIIDLAETGGSGGDDAFMKHNDRIRYESVYNIMLPSEPSIYDFPYFFSEDSARIMQERVNEYEHKFRDIIEGYEFPEEGINDLRSFLEEKKIIRGFAYLPSFNYELRPPLNFPSKNPVRFKLRIVDSPDEYYLHTVILRFSFHNSDSKIEIPLNLHLF